MIFRCHDSGPAGKSLLGVCAASAGRPQPPLCTSPGPGAGTVALTLRPCLTACWIASGTSPGCAASPAENDGQGPERGPCACMGGFCASAGFPPSGPGFSQVPHCPLFVRGLALSGRAACS